MRKSFFRIFFIFLQLIVFFGLIQGILILKLARDSVTSIISLELEESADQFLTLIDIHKGFIGWGNGGDEWDRNDKDREDGNSIILSEFYRLVQTIRIYDSTGAVVHYFGNEALENEVEMRERFQIPRREFTMPNGMVYSFEMFPKAEKLYMKRPALRFMSRTINYSINVILIAMPLALLYAFFFARKISLQSRQLSRELIELADGGRQVEFLKGSTLEHNQIKNAAMRLQEQLILKEKQQRSRLQELTHDLKSPLAGLYTQLESVELGALELSEERFGHFYREIAYLNRLIDDMAEVYRLEDGHVYFAPEDIRVSLLMNSLMERFVPLAGEKGMTIIPRLELNQLTADLKLVQRALGNLLSNSINHGKGREITVIVRSEDEYVFFDVINDGQVDENDLPHILSRYWSKGRNGSGLGLPITDLIARKHGGCLRVENLDNGKVLFSLSLLQS